MSPRTIVCISHGMSRAFPAGRLERRIAMVGNGTFFHHLAEAFRPNFGMIKLTMEMA